MPHIHVSSSPSGLNHSFLSSRAIVDLAGVSPVDVPVFSPALKRTSARLHSVFQVAVAEGEVKLGGEGGAIQSYTNTSVKW
jgi:hypothetical protein